MSKAKVLAILLGLLLWGSASMACDGPMTPASVPAVQEGHVPMAIPAILQGDDVLGLARFAQNAPPVTPSNRCEAQCVAEYRQCQATCRNVICLIPCEFLFDLCIQDCAGTTA